MCGEEALRVACRLEAPHGPLTLARRFVGVLSPIVQIAMLPMFHAGQDLPFGGYIAFQFIGDHHTGYIHQAFQQLAEELFRCDFIPPALHQDVQHGAVLVYSPPQVVALCMNGQEDLIEMPRVARSRTLAAQLLGLGLSKLQAPIPHRFVGESDAACGHEFLDIPIAQAEANVEPYTVANDLGWESMTLVSMGGRWSVQATSMPDGAEIGQTPA